MSRNITSGDVDIEDNTLRNILIIISYSVIVIVSLTGNILVCKVVYSNKKMRTTTNLLIVSLTVSDILTTILNIPFNCARILLQNWPFSDSLCIIFPLIQVACVYVSTLTMAVIGVHRYYSVSRQNCNEVARYLSSLKLSLIIALTWILSLILALPHSVFNQVVETLYNNIHSLRCKVVYPDIDINFPLLLTVEAILSQYLIPLSITCCLYIKIANIISKQGQMATHASDETNRRYCEAKRKRIVMLILVVATFAICWFPLNTYHLLIDLHLVPHNYTVFLIVHSFAMSSVCYNPFIYCWMNESFRRGATNMFIINSLLCRKNNSQYETNNDIEEEPEESQRAVLTCPIEQTFV
jgi:hypothetical protein